MITDKFGTELKIGTSIYYADGQKIKIGTVVGYGPVTHYVVIKTTSAGTSRQAKNVIAVKKALRVSS